MSDSAVDTQPTGDMASALHAAASEAGLDTNGNPVPSATDDVSDDATPGEAPPASDPQPTEKADAPTTPETVAAPPDTKPKGPIPFQRHEAILKTTREKVATETREAVEREIGPWRQVIQSFRPEEFAPILPQIQKLASDPLSFYHDLGEQLRQHGLLTPQPPPHAPTRSAAAQGEPEPDLVNPDTGELLYSAPQLQRALAWREQQVENRLRAEMRPLVDSHRQAQNERELAQVKTTAEHHATEAIAEASQWEGFDELKPKIAALMRQDRRYSLEGAYNRVFQTEYLPNLKQRERASVVAELNHKGRAASSAVSPQSRSQAGVTQNGTKDFRSELQRVLESSGASL